MKTMTCAWCGAPHAKVTDTVMDCPMMKESLQKEEKKK